MRPSTADEARCKVWARSAAHACPSARTSGASFWGSGGVSHWACRALQAWSIWALRRGHRVRAACCGQYLSGRTTSSIHRLHSGVRAMGCPSCPTPCHQKSPKALPPASGLRTLATAVLLAGNPGVAITTSSAAISACHWCATACDVWRVESPRHHGCTRSATLSSCCR